MSFGKQVEIKSCKTCFEEWIVEPTYVYFHICKGPKDFIVGEIVEEQREIEQIHTRD